MLLRIFFSASPKDVYPSAVALPAGSVLGLLSGAAIWSSFGGLVLAVLVAYALFGAALALFPSGRAQMRRAIGMARRFRRA